MRTHWPASVSARDPLGALFCHLKVQVGDENVTRYETADGTPHDHLEIPAYPLAEWVAENWWPLLWEPQKSEDAKDDPDFWNRHSFLAAQRGFALPDVRFRPAGPEISISAKPRTPLHADARFRQSATASVRRANVEGELRNFVQQTVDRLQPSDRTLLQQVWSHIAETDDETARYCALIGALGLSPYNEHPAIDRALDTVARGLSQEQLLDLCLTATPEAFVKAAHGAATAQRLIRDGSVPGIDLERLIALPRPADTPSLPGWRVGFNAAQKLRNAISSDSRDVSSADAVFKALDFATSINRPPPAGVDSPVTGAVARTERTGRIALLQSSPPTRRFAAARGAYFLWTSREYEARLMTTAVTRDQQASRAFAAELLVPRDYVRRHATASRLGWDDVEAIAAEACASPEVVRYQATNQGIQVAGRPNA